MSRFDAYDALAQGAIADVMADEVEFVGQTSGNYGRGSDPARPAQRIPATPLRGGMIGDAVGDIRAEGGGRSRRANFAASLYITADDWASASWKPGRDDLATIDPDGSPKTFIVASVVPSDGGDVEVALTPLD